jgi:hypothetical protein
MTPLKSICILLLVLSLFSACKKEATRNTETPDPVTGSTDDMSPGESSSQKIRTTSGKTIEINEQQLNNSLSNIRVIPLDFPHSRDTFLLKEVDPLKQVLVEDLDENGFEEIYLVTTSTGSGSYSKIQGFASNKDLSLTPIYLAEIAENDLEPDGKFYGYMGHDSIYVANHRMIRTFPVYKEGDENCCPTGGSKTLSYSLKPGEAVWQLTLED